MKYKREDYNISESEIIIYQTEDGDTKIDVKMARISLWANDLLFRADGYVCDFYKKSD